MQQAGLIMHECTTASRLSRRIDTIDGAVERILEELKEDDATGTARSSTSSGRRNVIYFDGWDGLGVGVVMGHGSSDLFTAQQNT